MTLPYWRSPPGWWEHIACSIGWTRAGSLFCAAKCEHGDCDQKVTPENLAAFEAFKAARARVVSQRATRRPGRDKAYDE